MPMILDVAAVQEARQEKMDAIEAIQALAKNENRDLTTEEAGEIETLLADYEALEADEIRAAAFERNKREIAAKRAAIVQQANQQTPAPITASAGESPEEKKRKSEPAIPKYHGSYRAFKGPDAERDAYYAGQFVIATMAPRDPQWNMTSRKDEAWQFCVDKGLIRADAQTSDDADKGGYLVPDGFSRAIIRIVEEVGVARRVSDVIPMDTETLTMSKRATGLTVYSPQEASAITTSEMTWSPLQLSVVDRATLTRVSIKLLRSAVTNIADRIAEEIGFAAALQMDSEFINGDGTSTYFAEEGLVPKLGSAGLHTAGTGDDTWPELDLGDHHTAMSLLPSRFWLNPVWICSPAYWNAVMVRLTAAGGGNTIQTLENGATRPVFLGYPVIFTDRMPTTSAASTTSALFGNFRAASMIGDRVGISIASSSERYFDSAEIAIRGMWAYDILVHEGGDASNAGAYTGVSTAA